MFDPLKAKLHVIGLVTLAFLLGIGLASGLGWTGPSFAMPTITQSPQVSEVAVRPALDLSEAFANVAEVVTPAVVRIEVVSTRRISSTRSLPIPEEFRRFFNFPDQPESREHPEVPVQAGGSGFFVSEDGYILTNNHVVEGAEEIRVYLTDGRHFQASVVGTDPTTDIAVIKVEGKSFPFLPLGRSDSLRVGEWVLAIGNPGFGGDPNTLAYTVTAGIVSAKGRPLSLIRSELERRPEFGQALSGYAIEDYIQTDAVINRGNSGGPMVNLRGQVVGVNSAIMTPTGYYAGYGFAVPIDLAGRVMEDLIRYGRVRRGWLGVQITAVTQEDQEYFNLPSVAGVLVNGVTEGSPAARAGLREGDIIYSVEGVVVPSPNGLQNLIARKRPRDEVTLRVYRDRSPRDIKVQLGEAPIAPAETPAPAPAPPAAEEKLGITVGELTPELARRWEYPEPGGVVVTEVTPLGPAARRGIVAGVKILEIDGEAVKTPGDVRRILQKVSGGTVVSVRIGFADGSTRIVTIRTANR